MQRNLRLIAERVPIHSEALVEALRTREPGCALFGVENPGGPAVLAAIAVLSEAIIRIAARVYGTPTPDQWMDD